MPTRGVETKVGLAFDDEDALAALFGDTQVAEHGVSGIDALLPRFCKLRGRNTERSRGTTNARTDNNRVKVRLATPDKVRQGGDCRYAS